MYCQDDGNGGLTASDLTATPPDAPTAICTARPIDPVNNFDAYYANDISPYRLGSAIQTTESEPPVIKVVSLSDTADTRQQITNLNGMYAKMTHILPPHISPDYSWTYEAQGAMSITRGEYAFMKGSIHDFSVIFYKNVSSSGTASFTLNPPQEMGTLVFSIARTPQHANRTEQITPIITITHETGTITLPFPHTTDGLMVPVENHAYVYDAPNWQPIGGADGAVYAHVGQRPHGYTPFYLRTDLTVLRDHQRYLLGIAFPTANVSNINISLTANMPSDGTSNAKLFEVRSIDAFKNVTLYEEVFPLPEGCVVPTPA